jgi:hypothetical protein
MHARRKARPRRHAAELLLRGASRLLAQSDCGRRPPPPLTQAGRVHNLDDALLRLALPQVEPLGAGVREDVAAAVGGGGGAAAARAGRAGLWVAGGEGGRRDIKVRALACAVSRSGCAAAARQRALVAHPTGFLGSCTKVMPPPGSDCTWLVMMTAGAGGAVGGDKGGG